MKKLLLLLTIIVAFECHAQWEWSPAETLTDTVSYNTNPAVAVFPDFTYMFFEKKADTTSVPSIYYKDIQHNGTEQLLLSGTSESYSKPYFFILSSGYDYYRYLFYLSDKSGVNNIYAMKLNDDGSFGTEQSIVTSADNIEDFDAKFPYITWEAGGDIYVALLNNNSDTLFTENTMVLDTDNCATPVIQDFIWKNRIFYLKTENAEDHIYYSLLDSLPFYWSEPKALDTTGDCHNISVPYPPFFSNRMLLWEKSGKLYVMSSYNTYDTIEQISFPAGNNIPKYQPRTYLYSMPVKNDDFSDMIMTYVADTGGNTDIFTYYLWEFQDISNDNFNNSNPKFFDGWGIDACRMYLLDIWETGTPAGHKYLNMSKTELYLCGGIDENKQVDNALTVSPNPAVNFINVELKNKTFVNPVYSIFNGSGQMIKKGTMPSQKKFSVNINGFKKGFYLIVVNSGNRKYGAKFLVK